MSGKKGYKKAIKEASKYRRLEIEVLLARYVEMFEYDSEPSRPEIDFADITNLLRAAYSVSQQTQQSITSAPLSQKEVDLIFRLYMQLRLDGRSQLLTCLSICEVTLINCDAENSLPDLVSKDSKYLRALINFFVPAAATEGDKLDIASQLAGILDLPHTTVRQQAECLVILTRLLTSKSQPLSLGVCISALDHLTRWVRNTDVMQTSQQKFFGDRDLTSNEKKSSKLMTELNGGPCQERFTVLNVGRHLSQSQLLHVEIILLFRSWLTCLHTFSLENPENELIKRTLSAAQVEIVFYCSRLLDQTERNLKNLPHRDLILTCLLEVIDLIHIVCTINEASVPQFYMRCSLLLEKCKSGDLPPVIAVKLMIFLVEHSESMGKDAALLFSLVFGDLLGRKYSNSDFAHELIGYIINKSDMLCFDKGITVRYFPNIAKLFIWNARAYLPQFVRIFPMFMEQESILEVLHFVLDMPAIAATMELAKALTSGSSNSIARQIWENPNNQGYIRYLMRPESGKGDTLAHMDRIFIALQYYQKDIRVTYNYDVSLLLLDEYFSLVIDTASEAMMKDIVPVILERTSLLYGLPIFTTRVKQILSQSLLQILQKFPDLVFDYFDEIREFLCHSENIKRSPDVYLSLLYAIGSSSSYASENSEHTEKMAHLYESLECILYELLGTSSQAESTFGNTFWCAIAAALAKLAIVVQDLIPRCSLALSKIQQVSTSTSGSDTSSSGSVSVSDSGLRQRVGELGQLLTRSNIGAGLLCPSFLTGWEGRKEADCLTPVLKTIDALAQCVLNQNLEADKLVTT